MFFGGGFPQSEIMINAMLCNIVIYIQADLSLHGFILLKHLIHQVAADLMASEGFWR